MFQCTDVGKGLALIVADCHGQDVPQVVLCLTLHVAKCDADAARQEACSRDANVVIGQWCGSGLGPAPTVVLGRRAVDPLRASIPEKKP